MVAIAIAAAGDSPDIGWAVPVGCPVDDANGELVGDVAGADAETLLVAHGWLRRVYRVPMFAVADFDGRALRLAVTKEAVRRGEWDAARRPPSAPP
jgi:hypothetical protein